MTGAWWSLYKLWNSQHYEICKLKKKQKKLKNITKNTRQVIWRPLSFTDGKQSHEGIHEKLEFLVRASSKDKVQGPDHAFDQLFQEKWLNTRKILLMQQKNYAKLDPGEETLTFRSRYHKCFVF